MRTCGETKITSNPSTVIWNSEFHSLFCQLSGRSSGSLVPSYVQGVPEVSTTTLDMGYMGQNKNETKNNVFSKHTLLQRYPQFCILSLKCLS